MYEYKAQIINIVDGDTFDLMVDLGFRIQHKIRARLLYIDTPEKRTKDIEEKELGLICTQLAKFLFEGQEVIIKSEKEETDINTDSFGRWLVYVNIDLDNLLDHIYEKTIPDSVITSLKTSRTHFSTMSVLDIYNMLGINKKSITYSPDAIRAIGEANDGFLKNYNF